ncbi:NUDIX hydrolase [Companilactobacillus halodurans]|uniref:NUDIX hydrolase n=1 Tax=Companilactobacillus halodurans TaxID=2584183 RepID=A0A5P0ZL47_9LACO|nr:NUDIX hydrolase [Companilactobacillus halodurans]MQS74938.1 NUDIX hydrolase [Companilactobacillus halodurans]MQS97191.1 NUDIX hydrolase [Companilactobacillus halodurans]
MSEEDSRYYEEVIAKKRMFGGKIFNVDVEQVVLPNGASDIREIVQHHGAVGIMPFTDDGKMIFVRQWRSPLEQETLEIPAGKIDSDEGSDLKEVALREMNEELGLTTDSLEKVTAFFASPGYSNEKLTMFKATNLKKVENKRPLDPDEFLDVEKLSLDEAKAQVKKGAICDSKTIYALTYWELLQAKEK